jgi:hypothetical protein
MNLFESLAMRRIIDSLMTGGTGSPCGIVAVIQAGFLNVAIPYFVGCNISMSKLHEVFRVW